MSVAGTWDLVINSPLGKQDASVDFTEEDGKLGGTFHNRSQKVSTEILDGSVSGSELTWQVHLQRMKMTLTFTTTVSDDTMSGKVKAGLFGAFDVSGHRAG